MLSRQAGWGAGCIWCCAWRAGAAFVPPARHTISSVSYTHLGSYKNIIVERVDSIETTLAHLLPEMTTNIVGALAVLVLSLIHI